MASSVYQRLIADEGIERVTARMTEELTRHQASEMT